MPSPMFKVPSPCLGIRSTLPRDNCQDDHPPSLFLRRGPISLACPFPPSSSPALPPPTGPALFAPFPFSPCFFCCLLAPLAAGGRLIFDDDDARFLSGRPAFSFVLVSIRRLPARSTGSGLIARQLGIARRGGTLKAWWPDVALFRRNCKSKKTRETGLLPRPIRRICRARPPAASRAQNDSSQQQYRVLPSRDANKPILRENARQIAGFPAACAASGDGRRLHALASLGLRQNVKKS